MGGGLNFPDLGGGWSEFSGPGFSNNLVHAGEGVWERGVSEFPGSEVRSGTPLYKQYTRYVPPQRAGFCTILV